MESGDEIVLNGKMYANSISTHAKYATLSLTVIAISIAGDRLLASKSLLITHRYLRAFADNATHALIAAVCWLMICLSRGALISDSLVVLQSLMCAITASLVDFDHAIAARSFDIKVISQLTSRPFLHCTTLTIFISLVILITGLLLHNWLCHTYGWIFLTATFTHQLRDAIRRGLWLYPIETKAVPFWLYALILAFYPLLCGWIIDIVAQQFLQRQTLLQFNYKTVATEEI